MLTVFARKIVLAQIILLFLCTVAMAEEEAVELKWKIPANGSIGYKASIDNISPARTPRVEIDSSKVFQDKDFSKEVEEKINSLAPSGQPTMFTLLTQAENKNILARLVMLQTGPPKEDGSIPDFDELMKNKTIKSKIQGEIDEKGRVQSFYLDQKQRNLLYLFFGMPDHKVKVGDSWVNDAVFLEMGIGFVAKEAKRVNKVVLKSLSKNEKKETIALLHYLIVESAEGEYIDNIGMKNDFLPTSTSYTYIGYGKFNVDQGRFDSFAGRMHVKAGSPMNADAQQEFTLELLPSVPEEYLKM